MNKIIFIPLIVLLISSCSYKPILTNKKHDFQFESIAYKGNNEINNTIKQNLIKRSKGKKKYNIDFSSNFTKEIFSSNEKGDPTIYKLRIDVDYAVKEKNQIILSNNISKQMTYNNISDKFELSKYEDNIIYNLSENISSEIMMSVSSYSE